MILKSIPDINIKFTNTISVAKTGKKPHVVTFEKGVTNNPKGYVFKRSIGLGILSGEASCKFIVDNGLPSSQGPELTPPSGLQMTSLGDYYDHKTTTTPGYGGPASASTRPQPGGYGGSSGGGYGASSGGGYGASSGGGYGGSSGGYGGSSGGGYGASSSGGGGYGGSSGGYGASSGGGGGYGASSSSGGSSAGIKRVKALYQFDPQNDDELPLRVGDIITVTRDLGEWYEGEKNGQKGIFPGNYVEDVPQSAAPAGGRSLPAGGARGGRSLPAAGGPRGGGAPRGGPRGGGGARGRGAPRGGPRGGSRGGYRGGYRI